MDNNNNKKVVRGGDKVAPPSIFVSECEVATDDARIQAVFDKLGLEYVLEKLWGFDINHTTESGNFYEAITCRHRTRGGKVVDGVRYSGIERTDDEWILQGNPSDEAKIAARQDLSYMREISKMSRQIKSA